MSKDNDMKVAYGPTSSRASWYYLTVLNLSDLIQPVGYAWYYAPYPHHPPYSFSQGPYFKNAWKLIFSDGLFKSRNPITISNQFCSYTRGVLKLSIVKK